MCLSRSPTSWPPEISTSLTLTARHDGGDGCHWLRNQLGTRIELQVHLAAQLDGRERIDQIGAGRDEDRTAGRGQRADRLLDGGRVVMHAVAERTVVAHVEHRAATLPARRDITAAAAVSGTPAPTNTTGIAISELRRNARRGISTERTACAKFLSVIGKKIPLGAADSQRVRVTRKIPNAIVSLVRLACVVVTNLATVTEMSRGNLRNCELAQEGRL